MTEGNLKKLTTGRWSIGDDREITSGDVIEVKIAEHWIVTRIEHDESGYYAVVPGIKLYEGMSARNNRTEDINVETKDANEG